MNPFFEELESRTMLSATVLAGNARLAAQSNVAAMPRDATPAISRKLGATLQKLERDLQTVRLQSGITDAQVQALEADAVAVLGAATRPSAASLKTLTRDAKKAAADRIFSASEKSQLTADVAGILQSANVPTTIASQATTDVNAILTSANISTAQVKLLVGDVDAVLSAFRG